MCTITRENLKLKMKMEQRKLAYVNRRKITEETPKTAKWKTLKHREIVPIIFIATEYYVCFHIEILPCQYVFFYLLIML